MNFSQIMVRSDTTNQIGVFRTRRDLCAILPRPFHHLHLEFVLCFFLITIKLAPRLCFGDDNKNSLQSPKHSCRLVALVLRQQFRGRGNRELVCEINNLKLCELQGKKTAKEIRFFYHFTVVKRRGDGGVKEKRIHQLIKSQFIACTQTHE